MIRRAFPHLTIIPPRKYGDHSPERFRWDDPDGGDRSTCTRGRPRVNGLADVRKS
jgi:hypothetical protein